MKKEKPQVSFTLVCVALMPAYYYTENLPKALIDLGVTSGTRLKADDFMQSYELMITILHRSD